MARQMRRIKQKLNERTCKYILAMEDRGVLALNGDGGYPYAIPMNYWYDPRSGLIYFHGAHDGYKIDIIERDDKACFTVFEKGYPNPEDWLITVRSVVCTGRIRKVTDHDTADMITRKIAQKIYPNDDVIEIDMQAEMRDVTAMALKIEEMTGKKVREG